MKTKAKSSRWHEFPQLPRYKVILPVDDPVTPDGIPIMFEDEGQEEMGETSFHSLTIEILKYGLQAHFANRPEFEVYSNLNVYYLKDPSTAYISPDVMVVQPFQPLGPMLRSYRLGKHGPVPLFLAEVLSKRSGQQSDFEKKPVICSKLGVPEYLLIDVTETYLEEGIILNVFQRGGTWQRVQDPDGGITSILGFRIRIEEDGWPRVYDAATGQGYFRPGEAEKKAKEEELARKQAEQERDAIAAKAQALEQEIQRLRRQPNNGRRK